MKPAFVITLGLLTAVAALTIDLSLPAIPAMVDALGTNMSKGQQIVGIFMGGMALGQIPAGLLSDRMGRMPIMYVGMTIFTLAAIVAAFANNIELILAARFVQGFGAAAAIVLSRAIVRDIASGQEAARLMSLMTMIFTAAPLIAPSIGALLIAQWDWRAPFILIAICGVLVLLAIRVNLVETHTPNADGHPLRQLSNNFREFFSHRQSIFALLLLVVPPAGFMSIIAVSATMIIEIYGYSVQQYGLIFACAGLSILLGSGLKPFSAYEIPTHAADQARDCAYFRRHDSATDNRLVEFRPAMVAVVQRLPVHVYDCHSHGKQHGAGTRSAAKNCRCRVVNPRYFSEYRGRERCAARSGFV